MQVKLDDSDEAAAVCVLIKFTMSNNLKSSSLVLGMQGPQSSRPCACCFENKHKFDEKSQLFKAEQDLRRMSAQHLSLLQTLHKASPQLAQDSKQQSIMDVLQSPADITVAELPRIASALASHAPLQAQKAGLSCPMRQMCTLCRQMVPCSPATPGLFKPLSTQPLHRWCRHGKTLCSAATSKAQQPQLLHCASNTAVKLAQTGCTAQLFLTLTRCVPLSHH